MKIGNIEKRLHNLNGNVHIQINRTERGWYVTMNAKLNRGYYDIKVTAGVRDSEHVYNERQVLACFRADTTDNICAKPHHDESDPLSDYCAWNFYRRINDLMILNDRVFA